MGEFADIDKARAFYLHRVANSSGVGELIMSRDATIGSAASNAIPKLERMLEDEDQYVQIDKMGCLCWQVGWRAAAR